MGLFDFMNKKNEDPGSIKISSTPNDPDINIPRYIPGTRIRNSQLLRELRCTHDVYDAIDLVTTKHPDASMARQSFLRLSNNGHTMSIFDKRGERNTEAETEWKKFASLSSPINTKGFDGLIDQCHDSQIRFGGFGIELVVNRRFEIEGIFPVLPQWINWEMDKNNVWHPFQQKGSRKIDLLDSNFFWVAMDNKIGTPEGTLFMESSLLAIENQLEFQRDSRAVLRNAGYPRNSVSIDRKSVVDGAPAHVRKDTKELQAYMQSVFDQVLSQMRSMDPEDDIVAFNDIVVGRLTGDNGRSMDLRAYNELIDPQVINGLSIMGIMLNRTTGITETWGTVQFKIITQFLINVQRGSKRLSENICRFWMRLNGYQGDCVFSHNPVDWESELVKTETLLKKQELNRKSEEYEWVHKSTAAKEAIGVYEDDAKSDGKVQYVKKSLGETK